MNLEIVSEPHNLFVTKVLEDFILNLGKDGISLGSFAEDIYIELQDEVEQNASKNHIWALQLRCLPGKSAPKRKSCLNFGSYLRIFIFSFQMLDNDSLPSSYFSVSSSTADQSSFCSTG